MSVLRRLAAGLADLIYPPACSLCQTLLDDPDTPVCPECRFGFDPIEAPVCDRCGTGLADRTACPTCRQAPPVAEQMRSAFWFGGPVQQAVWALKVGRRSELADYLADQLAVAALPGFAWGAVELLVPVPLHAGRRADRGFDQAALLALRLGDRLGLRVEPDALQRVRATPAQARLTSRADRILNVRDAFRVRRADPVAGRSVCLIDDVATTGATLDACAAVLAKAGAGPIRAVTLARTPLE